MIRFTVGLLIVCCVRAQPLDLDQHTALMSVYDGLGCNNATVCPRFAPSSNCTGLGLNCAGGEVTRLDLSLSQLTGSIPPTIGQLTALSYLELAGNQLTGSIPSTIGQLTALFYLSLANNQLTGSIPSTVGQLTTLVYLYLLSNQLTGSIPPTIGQLTALTMLNLYHNQLIGSIPSTIGQLTTLEYLYFYSNQLTGSIPSTFAQLSSLTGWYEAELAIASFQTLSSQLQVTTNEANCLDCLTNRATQCECATRTCPPTPAPLPKTTSIATSSLSIPPTQVPPTTAAVAGTSLPSTNATADAAIPATTDQPSDDITALIGGIVGGVVALLLVGGLIACLVARSRRRGKAEQNNGAALQSVRQSVSNDDARDANVAPHRSNYVSLALRQENRYDDLAIGPPQNYDAWSSNDDAKPPANRTDYEDFTKVH